MLHGQPIGLGPELGEQVEDTGGWVSTEGQKTADFGAGVVGDK